MQPPILSKPAARWQTLSRSEVLWRLAIYADLGEVALERDKHRPHRRRQQYKRWWRWDSPERPWNMPRKLWVELETWRLVLRALSAGFWNIKHWYVNTWCREISIRWKGMVPHVQLSINCRIGCCFTEKYFSWFKISQAHSWLTTAHPVLHSVPSPSPCIEISLLDAMECY